jgi:hypothetical protein
MKKWSSVEQAKRAIDRGDAIKARVMLQSILADQPDHPTAAALLRNLEATANGLGRLRRKKLMPSRTPAAVSKDIVTERQKAAVDPAKVKCPLCEAMVPKSQLDAHSKAFHPRGELEAPIPKKKAKNYPVDFVIGRKWGSDALDNAAHLNTTAGMARVKASRKKRGGR